ncbi:diguanylate cyclase domain-containing protein [Pseudomonadota bacterium]
MGESQKNSLSITWNTLRIFLLIFVPVVLLVAILSLVYYLSAEKEYVQHLQQQAKSRIELQIDKFSHEFESIVSDLIVLSAHQQLRLITDQSEAANYTALANELLVFSRNKKMYDQVRFLDATGMEIVRVNFNHGNPLIVPTDQLQSKGGRYYFKDTFSLKKGELFVSPFDLNIEGGAIERPLKPTIRFGLPIFNSRGEKRGVIVLNYLGHRLIEQIETAAYESDASGFGMLLNSDGYFFKGMQDEDEWGFMLPGKEGKTFSRLFPVQWNKIQRELSGQFLDDLGLFTFTTVFPLTEGLKSSSGSPQAFGSSVKMLNADQYYWKIVSFTPHAVIRSMTSQLREVLVIANILLGLLAAISLWLLARAIVIRQSVEAEMAHMAHFDQLTELPNRPMLYDRMGISLATAKRENKQLYIFFLDLDGFKKVNDTLGHEAGDRVLIEVARRLQQCVRETDTVARLGGDEFVLVLTSIMDQEDVKIIATRIISSLSKPILFNNQPCTVGSSIGIAMYPKDGETQDALLTSADATMYAVKKSGKNNYRFCS